MNIFYQRFSHTSFPLSFFHYLHSLQLFFFKYPPNIYHFTSLWLLLRIGGDVGNDGTQRDYGGTKKGAA